MDKASRIFIIGAGLGGLAFAQGLKRAKLPFTIFERDVSKDFRPQGYRLRINEEGADALKRTIDSELWRLFERTCAETRLGITQINALDASVTMSLVGTDPAREALKKANAVMGPGPYTADRTTLRGVLMQGLDDYIVYGKEFKEYVVESDGVNVYFADGTVEKGALLVGADGVRSRVRRQYLPNHTPVDTEGRCVYGKTPITAELREKFTKEAMSGMTMIQEKRQNAPLTLFLESVEFPNDIETETKGKLPSVPDYVYWVLASRKETFGLNDSELLKLSNKEAAELTVKLTENWAPSAKSLIELQDKNQAYALRLSSFVPNISAWSPSAHVTLIGDAAHVMSPSAGLGANTALKDAATLYETLVEKGVTVESIGYYEEQMRGYAKKAIEGSFFGGKKMYDQPAFEDCKPLL